MRKRAVLLAFTLVPLLFQSVRAQIQEMKLLNAPVDISKDFKDFSNTYYLADSLKSFNPATGTGELVYKRHNYVTRQAFNNMLGTLRAVAANEFPTTEYAASPSLPFSIQFVSDKTVRIRTVSGFQARPEQESLMLMNGKAPVNKSSWKYSKLKGAHRYTSASGSVTVFEYPWRVEIRDPQGKLLTKTIHHVDNADSTYTPVLPFSYVRRAADYSRSMNAAFALSPGEKIFGCGESFTSLDKRGQKVVLWADDANGVQNETMYKPIPFFMSSRGYGMFMHTSTPITCDFGKYFSGVNSLMIGDDELDLFVFLGEPKEVLNEYTNLTGKASMPPLWSFGFWMSRITYFSEQDGREVAANLRKHNIPADVIHYDTGWFTTDWRTDYKFAPDRFANPAKLMSDLKKDGFRVSLWQLPYFTPQNTLFNDLVQKNLVVKDAKGNLPFEDAVLDFSNPTAVKWYQDKIAGLLKLGVGAIKVDFGEAAPDNGLYHSGRTGFYEHNLYPLRYNKAVADITRQTNGENIIWARSAWAGSQRYPLHWGGDAANTNTAMAAELRGGLSLGLSGFSFWSHDVGGFVQKTPEDLYERWAAFGFLSSHTRSHGMPPKEPWEYSPQFLNYFRQVAEMRYKLMPYIYAQAKDCTQRGLPMLRALFVEYPNDPGAWQVDDQYLFGGDMLVAPLMEHVAERDVYLPGGQWIDYQTGQVYQQGWNKIKAGTVRAVILVRNGAVIPHIKLAQSTSRMDWTALELVSYSTAPNAEGLVCLPNDNVLHKVSLNGIKLQQDPYAGKIKWTVRAHK
ncbi:alpha-xylosidase [Pedobacter sp. SYSU D00535]|uniref:glycoside hydrolase family 31 protein n=1 Tax=Pedobacter sp. SYSU D00535 TaxID=2810308 RepID=UPI001A96A4C3|nr:alpha-xylosidase [Pedobacter sp. SYSU D00535]